MLTYNTGVQVQPPVTDAMQRQALAGLMAYGNSDVYAAEAQKQAVDYERAAAEANNTYLQQARQAQVQTGLQGLTNMAQRNQQDNELLTQRQGLRLGYAGKMLGGLNGALSSLFQ
jgi:hypothetical protein